MKSKIQKYLEGLMNYPSGDRISVDEYYMVSALVASLRSTCSRRRVGCILVDKDNLLLSSGYNGTAPKTPHCIDTPCAGAKLKSGSGLDVCRATHAEINAIVHCKAIDKIYKAYCSTTPCVHCIQALLATPCQEIIFYQDYPHSEASQERWLEADRTWKKYEI